MSGNPLHAIGIHKRGGARPKVRADDARGRPLLSADEPTIRKTITLPASVVAWLEDAGDGNVSLGVRLLVETAMTTMPSSSISAMETEIDGELE